MSSRAGLKACRTESGTAFQAVLCGMAILAMEITRAGCPCHSKMPLYSSSPRPRGEEEGEGAPTPALPVDGEGALTLSVRQPPFKRGLPCCLEAKGTCFSCPEGAAR